MSIEKNSDNGLVCLEDIGFRLRQERERLKLSVATFAASVGVSDRSQRNYESGHRLPDARYLVQAHSLGADTDYILTGVETSKRELARVTASIANERGMLEDVLRVFDIAYQEAQIYLPPDKMNACIVSMYVTGRYGGPINIEVANELITLAGR